MLWVEFYSFPLGDKQWHLAIDLPSRTLQQASQPESQETRAARNTEHATNKCRCTLQGTILVHETGQYVNTDNGPNRHNNKKQHQTILQDLTKQVCWSSTRQPAKRNEQFLQSWDKQNPNGHAFEQKGQGRLVVKWCMSNKMFLAHTKINEHPNDWSCGTQEPPSSEDPFAQITCVKIFKTSERTVCSKASWLPNQICTLALRVADKPEDCFRLLSDDVIINHKPTTIYNHLGGNLVFPADRFIRRV